MNGTGLAHQALPVGIAIGFTPPLRWARVKNVAELNRSTLMDTTDPDFTFRYVDIGTVDSTGRMGPQDVVSFVDAPSRARRLVRPGDSIVSTVRTYLRAIAYIDEGAEDLVVSTGFTTVTPGPEVHPRFLYWWLRSSLFVEEIVARSVGVSYPAVNSADVGDVRVPVPPMEEQHVIVSFLDAEVRRIDELIAEQERLISLVEEHRFAAVSAALGARLGGPLSDLGNALDQLPDSWRLTPLRFVATIQSGLTLGKRHDGILEERPYLRVANVHDGGLDLDDVTTIAVPAEVAARHVLRPGDVLMTEGGDNDKLGRGTVWSGQIPGCLHQNHIFAVRPDPRTLRPEFLAAVMGSAWGRSYFTATAHQTTNLASTNRWKVGQFPVPLPPIDEQDRLLPELEDLRGRLDTTICEVSVQVALLREHRQALITAAVTGGLQPVGEAA